jgi:hypothetical protein
MQVGRLTYVDFGAPMHASESGGGGEGPLGPGEGGLSSKPSSVQQYSARAVGWHLMVLPAVTKKLVVEGVVVMGQRAVRHGSGPMALVQSTAPYGSACRFGA